MKFGQLFKTLIAWRFFILIAAIPAAFSLPLRSGFTSLTPTFTWSNLSRMWANFDGIHYLNLAKYGYQHGLTGYLQAFFPIFPLTIRLINSAIGDYLSSGLILSNFSFVVACWLLVKLIRLDYSAQVARTSLLLLLLYPTSFFFGSLYSESLFLVITVASIYAARTNHWFTACLLAGIASATRVSGIFLLPLLLIEFWQSHHRSLRKALNLQLLWFFLAPVGLFIYMRFLNTTVGDPWYFAHIQPLFGAQREVNQLVLLYQVFFRYAKMLIFINHSDPLFFTVLLEFLTGSLFLVLCLFSFKYTRLSYAVYATLSYVLPTLTGTFSSMPRYVLVLFPCFIVLALWFSKQKPTTKLMHYLVLILFSIISISLFTRGYFIG